MAYKRIAPSEARRQYSIKRETIIVLPALDHHTDEDIEANGYVLTPHKGYGRPSLDAVARLVAGNAVSFYQKGVTTNAKR